MSIPGKPGLYKLIARMRNDGFIVESLADKKRFPVDVRNGAVLLKDVSIFTVEGDIPLRELFEKMKDNDGEISKLSTKTDPSVLRATIKKLVPDLDDERVRDSDIRKMIIWYSLLKDIIDFKEEEKTEETSAEQAGGENVAAKEEEVKPAKTKIVKAKKVTKSATDEEKTVAKKRAAKKSTS